MNPRRRFTPALFGDIAGVLLLVFAASVDAQAATLRWTKTYNGAHNGSDVGHGVAVAADGSIYVPGDTYVADGSPALLLRKYSPSGALLRTRTCNRILSLGRGVAAGADGGIYVTGSVYVPGQSSEDLLLQKYR